MQDITAEYPRAGQSRDRAAKLLELEMKLEECKSPQGRKKLRKQIRKLQKPVRTPRRWYVETFDNREQLERLLAAGWEPMSVEFDGLHPMGACRYLGVDKPVAPSELAPDVTEPGSGVDLEDWEIRSKYNPAVTEPPEEAELAAAARSYLWTLTAGLADIRGARFNLRRILQTTDGPQKPKPPPVAPADVGDDVTEPGGTGADESAPCCPSLDPDLGWHCTSELGHDGDHQREVLARWPQRSTDAD